MSAPEPHSSHSSEIAHVLFMDIVAYSTLPTGQQQRLLEELNKAVRDTPEFARASAENQLIRLPTGDGNKAAEDEANSGDDEVFPNAAMKLALNRDVRAMRRWLGKKCTATSELTTTGELRPADFRSPFPQRFVIWR